MSFLLQKSVLRFLSYLYYIIIATACSYNGHGHFYFPWLIVTGCFVLLLFIKSKILDAIIGSCVLLISLFYTISLSIKVAGNWPVYNSYLAGVGLFLLLLVSGLIILLSSFSRTENKPMQ